MPATTALAGPAAETPPLSGVAAMPPERFRLLVLGIAAVAAALAAEGVQTFAEMRARHYVVVSRIEATSPVAYGAPVPGLRSMLGGGNVPGAVVRADSAEQDAAALCALAEDTGADPAVRWIALTDAVDDCVRRRLVGRIARGDAHHGAEMRDARWIVVSADGTSLHSRRSLPAAAELRETLALLAPAPEPAP